MGFPFLLKAAESHALHPGVILGRRAAVNTAGSILGSLLCGFVLLEQFGIWRTMQLMAAILRPPRIYSSIILATRTITP